MAQTKLLQVYTGNGKGKTTAALGLAFRALGHGWKVAVLHFMKGDPNYGEMHSGKAFPNLTQLQFGRPDFVNLDSPDQVDLDLAEQGWARAKQIMADGTYNLLIMDELNVVLASHMLDTDEVLRTLQQYHGQLELVCTGRYAPPKLMDMADLVTEMKEIKHPYQQGIDSREGIEY